MRISLLYLCGRGLPHLSCRCVGELQHPSAATTTLPHAALPIALAEYPLVTSPCSRRPCSSPAARIRSGPRSTPPRGCRHNRETFTLAHARARAARDFSCAHLTLGERCADYTHGARDLVVMMMVETPREDERELPRCCSRAPHCTH